MPEANLRCAGKTEVVIMACAFGNSLTLPLAYLDALLSGPAFERAVGYTALTALAWAPLMWGLGQALLIGPTSEPQQGQPPKAPHGLADNVPVSLNESGPGRL